MSLQGTESQGSDLRAGLALFNDKMTPVSNLNAQIKSSDEIAIQDQSKSSKNSHLPSGSSTLPKPKPVGSNRFVDGFTNSI